MSWKTALLRPGIRRRLGLDVPRKELIAAELEDEMQLHLELRAEQLRKGGMSSEQARRGALTRYGSIDEATQQIREHAKRRGQRMQRRISFESFAQDVQFALRTFGRSKAWTAVAVLTLALGIGANTAVFSVINDLLLDPLRYPDADRLALIMRSNVKSGIEVPPQLALVAAWRSAKSVQAVEGVSSADLSVIVNGTTPVSARVAAISPTFPAFAGVHILFGRSFAPNDDATDAEPVALLSEHVWRARFGALSSAIGQQIKVADEEKTRTIVGVMLDGTRISAYSSEPVDIWIPLPSIGGYLNGPAVARLAPGFTLAAAQQELETIAINMPDDKESLRGSGFSIQLRKPGSTGQVRKSVLLLAGSVCLLLLIACANVAHLLLARGAARERELSIRAALGAGRARIARQLMTESMILAAAGCIGGIVIGAIALRVIVAQRPQSMSELANVHIDARVLVATIAMSVLTGIVFGAVAAFTNRGGRSFEVLRSSLTGTSDKRRNRTHALLVVTENALSVVLLVGAMLLIRTVFNLQHRDPGFDAKNMYSMSINLPRSRYDSEAARRVYAENLLTSVRKVPGVGTATIAAYGPTRAGVMIGAMELDGQAVVASKEGGELTAINTVGADYFRFMHMRLLHGHEFNASSLSNGEVIVSQYLAKRLWHDADPTGQRFRVAGSTSGKWMTVAGVVPDAALLSLLESGTTPAVYFPAAPAPEIFLTLLVRMRSEASPVGALRDLSNKIDPNMSAPTAISVPELLARTIASQRFMMSLLTAFATIAVLLSAIGLYGVITYMVSQSTREIGVRIALGAARRDVVALVMKQGVALSAAGLAIGLIASVWGTKLLGSSLYGVTATDPMSYVAGSAVLLLLAACACVAPTVRAVRIDPMVAMRSE